MKALSLLLLAAVWAAAAPIVELTVKERIGVVRNNEPVTMGVPLPEGLITDSSVLALTDSAGNKINCEFRKAQEWIKNTSFRWVHLDFQATLPESGSMKVVLHNDPAKHAVTGSALTVTDQGTKFEINTGAIRFTVKKANYNIIDEAWKGATQIIAAHSRGLALNIGATEYLSSSDAASATVIERRGPMAVCLKSTGFLKAGAASSSLRFIARTYAFNNSPVIKYVLALELNKAAVADSVVMRSLFVDLPTTVAGGTFHLGAPSADKSAALAAGDTAYVLASNVFNIANGANPAKVFCTFGGKASGTAEVMNSQTAYLDRNVGWGALTDGSKGLAFCLRDYWQQNPKTLETYGTGLCRVGLYPALRNGEYADIGWYSGMARTFEMRIALLGTEDGAGAKALVKGTLQPLTAFAARAWYCGGTLAAGRILDRDSMQYLPAYRKYVKAIDARYSGNLSTMLTQLNRGSRQNVNIDAYGFFDWGNTFHYADNIGDYSRINLKWDGNYYGLDHTMFYEFLRSGDTRYFDFFECLSRGNMDTHIYHAGAADSKTGSCRYCPSNHFVFNESRVLYTSGEANHHKNDALYERWYLCADERSLDVAKETAKWCVTAWPNGYSMPGQIRGPGAYIWMMVKAYENTKDTSYLRRAGQAVAAHTSLAPGSMSQFDWMGPLFMEGVILYDAHKPLAATRTFIKTVSTWGTTANGPNYLYTHAYSYYLTSDSLYLARARAAILVSPTLSNLYKDFAQCYRSTALGSYYLTSNTLVDAESPDVSPVTLAERVEIAPNPGQSAVGIRVWSSSAAGGRLAVVNTAGRVVRDYDLAALRSGRAGWVTVNWDGRDESGRRLPSGVYFMKVNESDRTLTKRVVLSK